jgi:hypothetical protein
MKFINFAFVGMAASYLIEYEQVCTVDICTFCDEFINWGYDADIFDDKEEILQETLNMNYYRRK